MSSIYNPEEQFPFDEEIIWKRAKDFLMQANGQRPLVLSDTIEPKDLVTGKLGNAWFTSALACLVEKPALLKKLFITQDYQSDGIYKV